MKIRLWYVISDKPYENGDRLSDEDWLPDQQQHSDDRPSNSPHLQAYLTNREMIPRFHENIHWSMRIKFNYFRTVYHTHCVLCIRILCPCEYSNKTNVFEYYCNSLISILDIRFIFLTKEETLYNPNAEKTPLVSEVFDKVCSDNVTTWNTVTSNLFRVNDIKQFLDWKLKQIRFPRQSHATIF